VPGLRPDDEPSAGVNSISKAWFRASLTTPVLFHALAFAGSVHRDFMRRSQIRSNSSQALSHKLSVLQMLPDILANETNVPSDEVILAILLLTSHEVETKSIAENKINPFNPPLQHVQWLDFYGIADTVPEHKNAALEILKLRGGPENLKLPGLAESFAGQVNPCRFP
jgi:hypothetical protein